jgi:hypothetical protein
MSMLLTFLFTSLAFFCLGGFEHTIHSPVYCWCFLAWTLAWSLPGSLSHFFQIYTKFDAGPVFDSLWNLIRPDTWLQIKGGKESQHVHPPAWNFVHSLPRYASTTIIYHCIMLLNCSTDGSTSLGNYRYPLIFLSMEHTKWSQFVFSSHCLVIDTSSVLCLCLYHLATVLQVTNYLNCWLNSWV